MYLSASVLTFSLLLASSATMAVANGSLDSVPSLPEATMLQTSALLPDFLQEQQSRDLFVGTPCSTSADCGTDCGLDAVGECFYPLAGSTSVVTCQDTCGPGVDFTLYCVPTCIQLPHVSQACSMYSVVEVNGCQGEILGVTAEDFCNPVGCPRITVGSAIPQQGGNSNQGQPQGVGGNNNQGQLQGVGGNNNQGQLQGVLGNDAGGAIAPPGFSAGPSHTQWARIVMIAGILPIVATSILVFV